MVYILSFCLNVFSENGWGRTPGALVLPDPEADSMAEFAGGLTDGLGAFLVMVKSRF